MKKTTLIIFIALVVFGFGLNWLISSPQESEHDKRSKVDTRIDNEHYWEKMAEKGYIPFNPETRVPPAVYKGSKIKAFSVITEDSPDVPVTTINSTQSETSIFVDPNNNEIVLNSNNSTQNPVGQLYGANGFFSFNAGESWGGEVQGAGGGNSGDPTTAIGLDGRWFVNFISNPGGMGIAYSDNQGDTWTTKTVAPNPGSLADKNHMWIDNSPTSPYQGNLYVAWTNFGGPEDSEIAISRSTDNGATWSTSVAVSNAVNAGSHNQGVNLSTGPNGEVYAIWGVYDGWPTDESAIGMAVSMDGGASWEPSVRIIDNIRGIRTTETSKNMRVNSFPSAAVDCSNGPDAGAIYVAWSNIGVPGVNTGNDMDVYVIKSSDKGETWGDPIRVNQDPAGEGKQHYFPWITVDASNGIVSLVFYDDRNVSDNETEVFCANSDDGGETWEDFQVSDVSFSPAPIPGLAGGYMGDYLGIYAYDGMVYPVWMDNRTGTVMAYVSPYETNSLNKPRNLSADLTFETGATDLEWTFEETPEFIEFNIYRDGELVGTTTDTTYTDMLPDYGVYSFQVTAVYPDDMESGAASTSIQWGDAHISVSPLSIYETLTVDSMATKYITVVNTGQLDLYYQIQTFTPEKAAGPDEYCAASGGGYEYISRVTFGDIDNPSVSNNYTDYSNLSTLIQVGKSYDLVVENGDGYNLDQCGVWIDWDQNGVFDDGMIEMDGSPGEGPYSASVTPPVGSKTGNTTMRVRIRYTGELDPCGNTSYGEVEDYAVSIQGWLDINPVVDTIQPGDTVMVAVDFDATDLETGMYYSNALFYSNDPDVDQIEVELTLEVVESMVMASVLNDMDEICMGTETQLFASPIGAVVDPTFEWMSDPEGFTSDEQNPMIMPEESTWYYVTMTSNGISTSDSVYLTVLDLPNVNIGADSLLCGSWQVELDAGPDGLKYLWSTGAETRTIVVDSTTVFSGYGLREISVTVYGLNGCVNADTVVYDFMNCTGIDELKDNISVNVYPNPFNGEFNIDLSAISDDEVEVFIMNQLGAMVYRQDGIEVRGNKNLKINLGENASGVYQLTVKGKNSLVTKTIISK